MNVRVIYFAAARELAACAREELAHTSHELALSEFVRWLGDEKPKLAPYLARMRFAINGELANMEARVKDGDEVVVLPPVAGGSRDGVLAEVRSSALSLDEVLSAVRHDSAGAI